MRRGYQAMGGGRIMKKKTQSNIVLELKEYPKTFALTNGRAVMLRPMRPDDRDRLFAFFRNLSSRDRRFFKHDVTQREVITSWCAKLDYSQVLPILALVSNGDYEKVIADGTLHTERRGWSTHVAEIRMAIGSRYRKKGLGRILLRELYDRAIASGIEKIQSSVRADDESSLFQLKRLGFKKEAVFRRHAVDTRGRKHDVVVMYDDLSELWNTMDDLNLDYDFSMVP
jgi:RimJ/RimL family protein N-acetyltransferase